ncbi:class I mannose-6-phosphate isomerase [Persicobacter psychrovividus]|uniref:Mannose-6-phosphate isomerase n=1 Tax=Persicobacter psychrovividus TaxID=387638 RepID=A0ABM7VHV2_9BACT|nr:mannose-6-phosphate isomerase [Persicobacter psychrovividus]
MSSQQFNLQPAIKLKNPYDVAIGWTAIFEQLKAANAKTVVIECYNGVSMDSLKSAITEHLQPALLIDAKSGMKSEEDIKAMVQPDVTDDRIFGYLSRLKIDAYFDGEKVEALQQKIEAAEGLVVVYGSGASVICESPALLVYADMARWEIQQRMRRNEVDSLGLSNRNTPDWMLLYKQGFFVDWRVLDRLKKTLFDKIDFLLDTNKEDQPKLIAHQAILEAYDQSVKQPFSVVPFFDPGPWGGQWMKEVCGLDPAQKNYAWCFNGVPEENSLLVQAGEELIEVPSINVVFRHPEALLGLPVYGRFGDEFPIRFDFLDTMGGGNLSLQVHPLTQYIQQEFGMHYTQDESYYIMDAKPDAEVYLGLKEGVDPEEFLGDLNHAQATGEAFDDTKHVQRFPANKHDHFLIPAGTVHCQGADSMVLEISATPYIFTFKLYDWGRVGMDGRPRPINIEHGKQVIQWNRTTEWTKNNLVNQVTVVGEGDGWVEERTGLHEAEFIETRRHWFTKTTTHDTQNSVNVISLVEGAQVVIESPTNAFEPFLLNFAEVVILPAALGQYTVRPTEKSQGKTCGTMKAFVRTQP